MEVSGIVFRPIPSFTGAGIDVRSRSSLKPSVYGGSSASSRSRCWRPIAKLFSDSEFCDNGHVQYYHGSTTPEIRKKDKDTKKSIKKRLKLVKGLSKDLSMFSDLGLGFGLEPHSHGLVDQVKARTISEATDVLLGQLQQLRAEEKEMKRKRKEEKAKLKAAKRLDGSQSSSSSSSDSSDSECKRGKVVDMSRLKSQAQALAQPPVNKLQQPLMPEATTLTPTQEANKIDLQSVIQEAILTTSSAINQEGKTIKEGGIEYCSHHNREQQQICTSSCDAVMGCGRSVAAGNKVEVCMGGKCKKSGAAALLLEFQRVLGAEGAAVGCKCMGKCRDGPNVRVVNQSDGVQAGVDVSVRAPTNPLCIGVGFEDVDLIVANYFGQANKEMGLAVPY